MSILELIKVEEVERGYYPRWQCFNEIQNNTDWEISLPSIAWLVVLLGFRGLWHCLCLRACLGVLQAEEILAACGNLIWLGMLVSIHWDVFRAV